ncbi:MAG TPA: nitroreductase [Methylocella sp.]|nr:nitroreductase [Methylocella sp.]
MNETIQLLRSRRSAPPAAMSGPGPSPEEVETLLALATRVPDHGKLAPWRFLLFERDSRARAGEVFARIYEKKHKGEDASRIETERKRFSLAPLIIGVISCATADSKIPEFEQILSAGAVCMNLIVAANAMGFASIWLTGWIAYDRDVLDELGLGANERVAGFIHIGRAPEGREDRLRPALAELVRRF